MASSSQPAMHTTFKEIKIHTAKCDECNAHNSDIIYRCMECAQQCCTPCWNEKKDDGTHLVISGSADGRQPTVVKADDVGKTKARKKKGEGKKRAPKKTAKVTKSDDVVDEDVEGDSDELAEATPTVKKTIRKPKKPLKSNSNVDEQDDVIEDEDLLLSSPSTASNTTVVGKKSALKPQSIKEKVGDGSRGRSTSDASLRNDDDTSKRKLQAVSHYDGEYAWAFQHAATEGRKRVKTTKTPVNHHSPPPKAEDEPKESMEYAKYLLELSRGTSVENPYNLASGKTTGSGDGQDGAAAKMEVDKPTLGSPIQLQRKDKQAYVESVGSKSDEVLHPIPEPPKIKVSKSEELSEEDPKKGSQDSETESSEDENSCVVAHKRIREEEQAAEKAEIFKREKARAEGTNENLEGSETEGSEDEDDLEGSCAQAHKAFRNYPDPTPSTPKPNITLEDQVLRGNDVSVEGSRPKDLSEEHRKKHNLDENSKKMGRGDGRSATMAAEAVAKTPVEKGNRPAVPPLTPRAASPKTARGTEEAKTPSKSPFASKAPMKKGVAYLKQGKTSEGKSDGPFWNEDL